MDAAMIKKFQSMSDKMFDAAVMANDLGRCEELREKIKTLIELQLDLKLQLHHEVRKAI